MSSRNDIQSAVKRNLHNWTSWRIDLNRRLTDAVLDGRPFDDHDAVPLQRYLATPLTVVSTPATPSPHHQHAHHYAHHHPAEHPRTLLAYSAGRHSETCMDQQSFLSFGIPRAKVLRYPDQGDGKPRPDDIINPEDYVTTPEDYEDAGEWEAGVEEDYSRRRSRFHQKRHQLRGHGVQDHYALRNTRGHFIDTNTQQRNHISERLE